MGVTETTVHGHIVYVDTDERQRWVGVVGPKATVWEFDAVTYSPDEFTVTVIGTGAVAQVDGAFGGNATINATSDNDGIQIQLLGEAYYLNGQYPCYFGIRFKAADVEQTDILVGLCIQDLTALGAVSDGAYFETVDESTVLNFVLEQDNTTSSAAAATLVDDTWIVAEFYYNGLDYIHAYIDGELIVSVALTDTNFPDDEYLSPIMAMLCGDATNPVTIDWVRAYQIRE